MQSFKWCVLRCCFGRPELAPCGITAVLVYHGTKKYRERHGTGRAGKNLGFLYVLKKVFSFFRF